MSELETGSCMSLDAFIASMQTQTRTADLVFCTLRRTNHNLCLDAHRDVRAPPGSMLVLVITAKTDAAAVVAYYDIPRETFFEIHTPLPCVVIELSRTCFDEDARLIRISDAEHMCGTFANALLNVVGSDDASNAAKLRNDAKAVIVHDFAHLHCTEELLAELFKRMMREETALGDAAPGTVGFSIHLHNQRVWSEVVKEIYRRCDDADADAKMVYAVQELGQHAYPNAYKDAYATACVLSRAVRTGRLLPALLDFHLAHDAHVYEHSDFASAVPAARSANAVYAKAQIDRLLSSGGSGGRLQARVLYRAQRFLQKNVP